MGRTRSFSTAPTNANAKRAAAATKIQAAFRGAVGRTKAYNMQNLVARAKAAQPPNIPLVPGASRRNSLLRVAGAERVAIKEKFNEGKEKRNARQAAREAPTVIQNARTPYEMFSNLINAAPSNSELTRLSQQIGGITGRQFTLVERATARIRIKDRARKLKPAGP